MEKESKFNIGEFIITYFDKEITLEQLRCLGNAKAMDENSFKILQEERKCNCIRVEHNTGVWAAEYPYYCNMYFALDAFHFDDETDKKALANLLHIIMEDSTIVGDEEYYMKKEQNKKELAERQ